jgi:hypothetical protein
MNAVDEQGQGPGARWPYNAGVSARDSTVQRGNILTKRLHNG